MRFIFLLQEFLWTRLVEDDKKQIACDCVHNCTVIKVQLRVSYLKDAGDIYDI